MREIKSERWLEGERECTGSAPSVHDGGPLARRAVFCFVCRARRMPLHSRPGALAPPARRPGAQAGARPARQSTNLGCENRGWRGLRQRRGALLAKRQGQTRPEKKKKKKTRPFLQPSLQPHTLRPRPVMEATPARAASTVMPVPIYPSLVGGSSAMRPKRTCSVPTCFFVKRGEEEVERAL